MRDRAIAYSEELRKVSVDAPVLDYKDTVHEFATLDTLLKTPQAQASAEDIAIWVIQEIHLTSRSWIFLLSRIKKNQMTLQKDNHFPLFVFH